MTYKPHIDGLRAIAILLVLLFHGKLALFPAGFIGVDMFFVISGFLITGIIHEALEHNRFSFIEFYTRRLWRLQPALICMMVLTTVLALCFFLPDDLVYYSTSARKTSIFTSNMFFNRTATGYFSPNTHILPLLHTWSLSIEWQCYLILPVVIYLLHKVFGTKKTVLVLYALTFVFLLISIHLSKTQPLQSYYRFSGRVFEFLIGSCIALLPLKTIAFNRIILNTIGLLALSLILYSASLDNIIIGYPNWIALGVCIATGLLIALGINCPSLLIIRLLSFKPLVFIGLLSYSLYIWHWSVFSIMRYQSVVETPKIILMAFGLTFILAYLSWKFIETPSRHFRLIKARYTLVYLLLLPIVFTHGVSFLIKKNLGFPQRFNQELARIYQQLDQYKSDQRPSCIDSKNPNINSKCIVGSVTPTSKRSLLIGDSFSNQYWGFMDTLGRDAETSIVVQGFSACITLPDIHIYDWFFTKNSLYQNCFNRTEKYYQYIRENHYDYVIIGQYWGLYYTDKIINKLGDERSLDLTKKRLETALDKALNIIIDSGAKPILIKTTALRKADFTDCFFKPFKRHQSHPESSLCDFNLALDEQELWFDSLFRTMKKIHPQLTIIDPKEFQCPKGRCKAEFNGVPMYRDEEHISDYASYQLGSLYLQKYPNPLS